MPGVILLYSRYRDSTNIVTKDYQTTAEALVTAGQFLAEKGWAPATSGNYSARLDGEQVAITVSGRDKGRLVVDDIMVVDFAGQSHHS